MKKLITLALVLISCLNLLMIPVSAVETSKRPINGDIEIVPFGEAKYNQNNEILEASIDNCFYFVFAQKRHLSEVGVQQYSDKGVLMQDISLPDTERVFRVEVRNGNLLILSFQYVWLFDPQLNLLKKIKVPPAASYSFAYVIPDVSSYDISEDMETILYYDLGLDFFKDTSGGPYLGPDGKAVPNGREKRATLYDIPTGSYHCPVADF